MQIITTRTEGNFIFVNYILFIYIFIFYPECYVIWFNCRFERIIIASTEDEDKGSCETPPDHHKLHLEIYLIENTFQNIRFVFFLFDSLIISY